MLPCVLEVTKVDAKQLGLNLAVHDEMWASQVWHNLLCHNAVCPLDKTEQFAAQILS